MTHRYASIPGHLRFNEDLVADLIVKKLALEDVSFTWRRAGKDTHVLVKKRQTPPKTLRLPGSCGLPQGSSEVGRHGTAGGSVSLGRLPMSDIRLLFDH
ncbi:hypothetical protein AB0E67_30940 [Streptomyces sp. NPDC032161]|uniref:hypothetical protein n=1 Tax=unclassified Streptomyces TaxID=2593676 RepID=UPI00340EE65F